MVLRHAASSQIGDISHSQVEVIEASSSVQAAALKLDDLQLDFAPVVDEVGRCVGVISARDFMRHVADRERTCSYEASSTEYVVERDSSEDAISIEFERTDLVSHYMSKSVQSIEPEITVSEAARIMLEEQIHHLVLLDTNQRPVGVVSALDLAALLTAARS